MSYYEKYRKGVIQRHIASNGRLLQDVMLDENNNIVRANGLIVGGGDNPFLYGGLLMATFCIEAMLGVSKHSFYYASKLFDYFLISENHYNCGPITQFKRRKNYWKEPTDISKDELCGIILGTHFYIEACKKIDRPIQLKRALGFLERLALYLKSNKYKPHDAWVFEYPFGCVFQHHLGNNFKPRWFSKAIFYGTMWALPLVYRMAILFKAKRNFYNVALYLHCVLMLTETKNTSWLKAVFSRFYEYFADGDGRHNAYLETISISPFSIGFNSVVRPKGVFTEDLPKVELKDKWEPTHNLIGECFTWEHSNTAGHQLKYWWDKALVRMGPASRDQLNNNKCWVESCGLGLLFVKALLGYKKVIDMPILESDAKYEILSYEGAY